MQEEAGVTSYEKLLKEQNKAKIPTKQKLLRVSLLHVHNPTQLAWILYKLCGTGCVFYNVKNECLECEASRKCRS